jgi:hypothetical protein
MLLYRNSDLAHGVPVPEGGRLRLLQRVKVHGDAEGNGNLVSSGVTATDRAGRVVHSVGHSETGQCSG